MGVEEQSTPVWSGLAGPWTPGRIWRLFGTALSFAVFGIAGLALAVVYFPLLNLVVRDCERRAELAQATVHNAFFAYIEFMRLCGVLTYEIHGSDRLRNLHGSIVVANHPSLLDVVFLMAFMRRTRAVVKPDVATNPFMRGVVKASNYIPSSRDPDALIADCANALRGGANLCIFPEGSRTPAGEARRYQRGYAYVAVSAGAPVVAATIKVSPPTLRKNEPWYSIPHSKPHWTIRVHQAIDTASLSGGGRLVQKVRSLTRDIETIIERELQS